MSSPFSGTPSQTGGAAHIGGAALVFWAAAILDRRPDRKHLNDATAERNRLFLCIDLPSELPTEVPSGSRRRTAGILTASPPSPSGWVVTNHRSDYVSRDARRATWHRRDSE